MHLKSVGQTWDQLSVVSAKNHDIDELHPLETKIIFDSPIQDTTLLEIDDISEQLNDRQKNALFHAEKNGQIATKEYVEINRVSRGITYVELRDLTDKGLLTVIGKGRGTKYIRKLSD